MSAIALSWVASIQVGNATAKSLLRFYASHNFQASNHFEFTVNTLAHQLEVSERSIQNAHAYLLKNGFIQREIQYGKNGVQLRTVTTLCIPQEFIDKFMGKYTKSNENPVDKSGGEGERPAPYPEGAAPSRVQELHPLIIKGNNKKLFYKGGEKENSKSYSTREHSKRAIRDIKQKLKMDCRH